MQFTWKKLTDAGENRFVCKLHVIMMDGRDFFYLVKNKNYLLLLHPLRYICRGAHKTNQNLSGNNTNFDVSSFHFNWKTKKNFFVTWTTKSKMTMV